MKNRNKSNKTKFYLQAAAKTLTEMYTSMKLENVCVHCAMVMKYLCFVSIELIREDLARITTPIQKCNESNEQAISFNR